MYRFRNPSKQVFRTLVRDSSGQFSERPVDPRSFIDVPDADVSPTLLQQAQNGLLIQEYTPDPVTPANEDSEG